MLRCLAVVTLILQLFAPAAAQRLVLPGDHPDPSVTKIGGTYWASSTSSNWMPAYPLLKSTDLLHWTSAGSVFKTLPAWADYYFWAPELTYDKGKVYVYYAAHKKGGNLCIGIASANNVLGPYKDHGPVICQPDGAIDAFPMRDENGRLQIIWKEDGNSIGQPTPIWMQELNEERTAVIGEKKELFRNDQPWEGNLVEGVSMIKHNDWFYAFYAAAGCCGTGCSYQSGVARAKKLSGPWEKFPGNPVLTDAGDWKCPGHGTAIEKNGRFYFLYHAYQKEGGVFTGRQGLLQEFRFTQDDWIQFITDSVSTSSLHEPESRASIDNWEWSVFNQPITKIEQNKLTLSAMPTPAGAYIARKSYALNYDVTVTLDRVHTNAGGGLALIGDDQNAVMAYLKGSTLYLAQVKNNVDSVLASRPVAKGKKLYLKMEVRHGKDLLFFYSLNEKLFSGLSQVPVMGNFLPPWDRGLRAGIVAKGSATEKAVYYDFKIKMLTP